LRALASRAIRTAPALRSRRRSKAPVLRITTLTRDGTTWLALEGALAGPWVDELRTALASARGHGLPLALDLAAVRFADARGVTLLREQAAAGRIQRSSSFVAELLRPEESS
jgi:hypothetical protein